jgi:perosamine synthetase
MGRIPIAGPWITQKEIDYVTDAVTRGWYQDAGIFHERFERAFAEHLGVRHAMALPSCTSAIHLALLALGLGPGDEVVVPDSTWIATSAPVSYVGATPVFADVDPVTWCLSAESFEARITSRTKAVIPVDLYGGMPDWSALHRIAAERGIAIIEDAAEAIGSEWRGRKAGTLGNVGVFSFHGSKTLTTGEGGLLATDDDALFERASVLRDHGRRPGDRQFWNLEVAHKYRMSSMQAALGLAQLERLPELVERKREIFDWYRRELGGVPGVAMNAEPEGTRNSYWMVTLVNQRADAPAKEELIRWLGEHAIDSRPFFYPLSSLPAYARPGVDPPNNPVSHQLSRTGVNLPSALNLTRNQVGEVARAVIERLGPA